MKTTKLFFMAALALMTAACSNGDNDILTPAEQPANNMVTITAKLAPKSGSAQTRALSDQTTYIKAEWAQNEQLKIISANGYPATANIDAVDGSGVATISFTIDAAAKGKDCTIIYPATAAVTESAGVYTALPMTAQTGTLTNDLDVRIGKGTITDEATPQLEVTTQPAAQFAIWKLTLDKTAKDLYITAGGEFLAGATLASAGTVFTVAVPSVSSKTVAVVATDGSSDCWSYSKDGVSLATGNYYQSNVAMAALDDDNSKPLYKITATSSVTIPDGKTIVLSGVTISDGIICSGNANIILMGGNEVTAASGNAAIKIGGSGTTLTITGSGSLTVRGGSQAAAIGTGRAYDASVAGGNIEINGGTIDATGGASSAAIGTGYVNTNGSSSSNTCGTITINGGSVTATGGNAAAGIGTGSANNSGSNECGAITINGGTVIAIGKTGGAGIGTGSASNSGSNECGAITISTGVTSVTATKGNSSPNIIGKGYAQGEGTQNCGTITFGSAQVFNGTDWSPATMVADTYGGLNLAITNSNKTWTLTPAP